MRISTQHRARRSAFTLIELLVVIAIIAVLAALTTAAIMRVLGVQPEKETMSELLDFGKSMEEFKKDFGFYPPSKFVLCASRADYAKGGTKLHDDSLYVLNRMFGDKFNGTVDWSGRGVALPPGGEVLDGDQCLVFFLGGINNQGFAKIGNPTAPKTVSQERFGPYFNFKANRFFARSGKAFYSYMDPYSAGDSTNQSPYIYFVAKAGRYTLSDAHLGVTPYMKTALPTKTYHNADSYQIISAGHDGQFGPGGLWTPASASSMDLKGADDQANFHTTLLGS